MCGWGGRGCEGQSTVQDEGGGRPWAGREGGRRGEKTGRSSGGRDNLISCIMTRWRTVPGRRVAPPRTRSRPPPRQERGHPGAAGL